MDLNQVSHHQRNNSKSPLKYGNIQVSINNLTLGTLKCL